MDKNQEYETLSNKISKIRNKYKGNEMPNETDCWFYHQYSENLKSFVNNNPTFWSSYSI